MILFREEHVPLILSGRKTQTRRLWPHGCRVKVDHVYQCRTRMLDKASTFARVRILRVWQTPLSDMTDVEARAEGYSSRGAFRDAFNRINRMLVHPWTTVWAVEFELVPEAAP